MIKDKCKHCKGRGIEVRPRTVKVRIPAGVDDGQRIRVKGRGTPGLNGGPPGDLYVVVHVAPHPVFARSGKWDLTVKVPVTFPEAVLGAQVKVPTLDAPVTVKVPPGHADAARRSACAAGASRAASGDPGALLVTFDVVVPTSSTTTRRAAVEQLASVLPGQPARAPGGVDRWTTTSTRALHHLGRGRARRRPPPDPAHLRAQGPDRAEPHRGPQPALLRPRHRVAPAHPGAHQRGREPGRGPPDPRARGPGRGAARPASPTLEDALAQAHDEPSRRSATSTAATGATSSR